MKELCEEGVGKFTLLQWGAESMNAVISVVLTVLSFPFPFQSQI